MTASDWNWLLTISGTVASVAGVVFSCLAWRQAAKAKDAAREAVAAVRIRSLSHSFSRWAVDARDLLGAMRDLQFADAQRAATELLGALSHNRGWLTELRQSTVGIEEVVRLLDFVNNYLSDEEVFFGMRDRLVQDCQTIYKRLSEVAGAIDAKVEGL
jgi:hypothetical protein